MMPMEMEFEEHGPRSTIRCRKFVLGKVKNSNWIQKNSMRYLAFVIKITC